MSRKDENGDGSQQTENFRWAAAASCRGRDFQFTGDDRKKTKKKRRKKSENFGVAYFWEALSYLSLLVKFMLRSKRFIC